MIDDKGGRLEARVLKVMAATPGEAMYEVFRRFWDQIDAAAEQYGVDPRDLAQVMVGTGLCSRDQAVELVTGVREGDVNLLVHAYKRAR